MSHLFSFAAVALLSTSILFNIISLSVSWWQGGHPGSIVMDASLFVVSFESRHVGLKSGIEKPWSEVCQAPEIDKEVKGMCPIIETTKAFVFLGMVFAFLAATGNAAGIYTGNTLIDSAAGLVAAFSALCSGLSIFTSWYAVPGGSEGLTGPGYLMTQLATAQQLVGGVCGCLGTCQEMREMAKLAASLHIGEYKEPEKQIPRSEKCAVIREGEQAESNMIFANLQKRKKAAEAAAAANADSGAIDDDDDKKEVKKIPVALKKVLFRKPVDGDDDEIPTKMLEDAFAEIDGDGSGSIDMGELVENLALCGLNVSRNASDTIMAEIDKNASGDIDLREFIEFFRHIEDLNRFSKKSAARQQFLSFLLNFCFLADIVVVGVMLMMFIRMDPNENPDMYSIMKNVLTACGFLLLVLFVLVILMPILRLALGPTVGRMQKQYELAQEIKKASKKPMGEEVQDSGPRQVGYSADEPPPPVNAAMFGRSYRPGKVETEMWSPAIEDIANPAAEKANASQHNGSAGSQSGSTSNAHGDHSSAGGHGSAGGHSGDSHGKATTVTVHGHGKGWRYDPSNYSIANEHANMMQAAGLGPTSWTPAQVQGSAVPKQTAPITLPGMPLALTDAAFPQPRGSHDR